MTSQIAVPDASYLGRMRHYFAEMFPVPSRLGLSALAYLAIASFARDAHGVEQSLIDWSTVVGVLGVFLLLLVLRLMDELKDLDLDRWLFPERPLPSGMLRVRDVEVSLGIAIACYLALHLFAAEALVSALVVLAWAILMFVHFFARDRLRGNLLLTLATHQPIVPLFLLHGFVVFAAAHGIGFAELRWSVVAPFCAMLWMPFLGWEISRKIRAPEQEDDYVTYSRVLGRGGAVALLVAVEGIAVGAGAWLWMSLALSPLFLSSLGLAFAIVLVAAVQFLRRSTAVLAARAKLLFVVFAAAQIVEFGVLSR